MVYKEEIKIEGIPAIIWGEPSNTVYIYVHGKMGSKENADGFANIAVSKGYQVVSFDLPEHGERRDEDYPIMVWNGVRDLQIISEYVIKRWNKISLFACSLGAYFSLLAYKDLDIDKALLQCPVLDMNKLIRNMMKWFDVKEEDLKSKKNINTPIGETLNWDYWIYTKENPVSKWIPETYILYPSKDTLTEREVVDEFVKKHNVNLQVMDGAEHYFTL